jgi:hypothetical protein
MAQEHSHTQIEPEHLLLALGVLAGEFHEGDVVIADVEGDSIVFRARERVEEVAA